MIRAQRAVGIAVVLAGTLALAACTPATVCDRRYVETAKKYQIRYQSEVDDGTGRRTSDWITVNGSEYEACQIGSIWPRCKRDARNEQDPAATNAPRRDPRWDQQDANTRTVCFDFISNPSRKLTYRWSTPRREKGPRDGVWGVYSECVSVQAGDVVRMKVEHITGPSMLLCAIYIMRGGKKVVIDMAITQAFGDCDVEAIVPPR